jgi:hypothetical protein
MSTTASKQNKRTAVYLELKAAKQHLKNAKEELGSCERILSELMAGKLQLSGARILSQATHVGDKPRRDAIPVHLRKRITALIDKLGVLMEDIRAIPVTQDEKAAAKLKKAKKSKKGVIKCKSQLVNSKIS